MIFDKLMTGRIIKLNIILAAIFLNPFNICGQEFLIPATPDIMGQGIHHHHHILKSSLTDTLEIPFFDDFSKKPGYPDSTRWIDSYAYINNTYSGDPVSIGVATLDAVNDAGILNGDTETPFTSDYLTTKPINLRYPGRTDIFLSFFFQPQGLGDEPEEWDSLIVEFYSPSLNKWNRVWSTEGRPAEAFQQVFIPVIDTIYLQNGFRFRFMNYASLPKSQSFPSYNSNVDHWNIDYVYLDTTRSPSMNIVHDVSMITSLPSMLKIYEAMPWNHFPNAFLTEIRPTLDISYRNNDTLTRNVTRLLRIKDIITQEKYSLSGGAVNVERGLLGNYEFPYSYPFVFYNRDSTVFEIKSYLVTDEDDYKQNDTVIRYQMFYNFYAYDDGSAEFGYGISGEGTSNAALACQFKTYAKDTLRAVRMYFNRTLDNVSQNYFLLSIWNHNSDLNQPGELIYSMTGYKPEYQQELNKFITYVIDTLLVVSDIFYVGWIQTTNDLLNVGFDRNTNSKSKIFYNLGQEWANTSFQGSLMIRPILGKALSWPASTYPIPEKELHIYPNPASDIIRIELPPSLENLPYTVSIYNVQGRLIYEGQPVNQIVSVESFLPGLYLIRADITGMKPFITKLLISR
ncbi:MAG: hypothetical protein AMS27_03465 [Bacteroides sp. SM23_62_1]|nr:MAG: hypothetical protein AMS27_03465 [Bacteroides sp. SM23_62_1]